MSLPVSLFDFPDNPPLGKIKSLLKNTELSHPFHDHAEQFALNSSLAYHAVRDIDQKPILQYCTIPQSAVC
jgi:hypothetical protein